MDHEPRKSASNREPRTGELSSGEEEGALREIWAFLRVRKKFWLAPIILVLMILGFLIVFAGQSAVLSPFFYML